MVAFEAATIGIGVFLFPVSFSVRKLVSCLLTCMRSWTLLWLRVWVVLTVSGVSWELGVSMILPILECINLLRTIRVVVADGPM